MPAQHGPKGDPGEDQRVSDARRDLCIQKRGDHDKSACHHNTMIWTNWGVLDTETSKAEMN